MAAAEMAAVPVKRRRREKALIVTSALPAESFFAGSVGTTRQERKLTTWRRMRVTERGESELTGLEHVVFCQNRDSPLCGFLIQASCWGRRPAWMTRPHSEDIRERALARADAGETVRSIAQVLRISPSCVSKWKKLRQQTGGVAPGKIGGHKK